MDNLDNEKDYFSEDIFLIDSKIRNIEKICIKLKSSKAHRHKPIFLLYEKNKKKAVSIFEKNVGVTDVIDKNQNPSIISCRVNSQIKYKRLLDAFYRDVKRNIYMSSIDALTEVYNRSFLEDYLSNRELALSHSAVLMIDLDKFKEINDKYGHTFADKVLKEIATQIKSYIRLTDLIFRYGGDEFIIFMRNVSRSDIEKTANRLVASVSEKLFNGMHCSISMGVCFIDTEVVKLREAIFVADSFMYISKQAGGNAVHICG